MSRIQFDILMLNAFLAAFVVAGWFESAAVAVMASAIAAFSILSTSVKGVWR